MLYHFMTTPDGTTVSYSEIKRQGGKEKVRIYAEKWNEDHNDFDSIELYLPDCKEIKVIGFSQKEAKKHIKHFRHLKRVIWDCAEEESD